jgi:hypothetical protein
MTDPAATLVQSICALSADDYDDVLHRLEDRSHGRLPRGSTWSIFKAVDAMDRDECVALRARVILERAKTPSVAGAR